MKRTFVVLAIVGASALALTVGNSASAVGRKCIPDKQAGIERVKDVTVIVYCGHATATLKGEVKTTKYAKGACYKTVGNLIVGFGKFTTPAHPIALFESFYLVVPSPQDGTYRLSVLSVQHKGKRVTAANNVKVVVKSKRSRGTFNGKFLNGNKFTGSFICG